MNARTQIISSPGKFEGEPVYVREFADCQSDEDIFSGSDESLMVYAVYYLTAKERKALELDEDDENLILWTDSQGFVYSRLMSDSDLGAFRAEVESEQQTEDEDGSC